MRRGGDETDRARVGILAVIGGLFVVAGCVVLAFVVFMVFGTALLQGGHQRALRAEIERVLPAPTPSGPPRTVPTIAQPPLGAPIAAISIPAISLNMIVVQGTAEPDLEQGPGHYADTALPGEAGNTAIAGHRTTWARPFYNLNQLKPGNPIIVTTARGMFTYSVSRVFTVDPVDVSVLASTTVPSLTLTTCNPRYAATQRLIVRATLSASSVTPPSEVKTLTHYSIIISQRRPSAWPSVVLGLATGLLALATVAAFRRLARPWPIMVVSGFITLGLLVTTFAYLAPLLPPNL